MIGFLVELGIIVLVVGFIIGSLVEAAQNGKPAKSPKVLGETMDFSRALLFVKSGHMIQRAGWNGKGMYVAIQQPDAHSANTLPYLWMRTADAHRVPWLASQTDILAEDWAVL